MTDDQPTAPGSGAVGLPGQSREVSDQSRAGAGVNLELTDADAVVAEVERQATARRERLRSWALMLASRGYHVVPVEVRRNPDGKKRLRFPMGRRWQDTATTEPAEVEAMPWASATHVFMATEPSGVVVPDLDIGSGKDGPAEWARLLAEHPTTPAPPELPTGSGGRHLFFRATNRPVKSGKNTLGPGIDTRAVGGGLIMWSDPANLPPVAELPECPAWIPDPPPASARAANTARKFTEGQSGGLAGLLALPPDDDGRGNDWLTRVAGHLAKRLPDHGEYLALLRLVDQASTDPHPDDLFAKTAESIWEREQARHADEATTGYAIRRASDTDLDSVVREKLQDLRALYQARKVFDAELMNEEGDPGLFQSIDWDEVTDEDEVTLDSAGLFYAQGKVLLAGDSESGKTWLAHWTLLQHVRHGRVCSIYELEMGDRQTKKRLQLLGATHEDLRRIKYYRVPEMTSLIEQGSALNQAMLRDGSDVIMYDAVIPLVMESGLDNNSAVDIRRFINRSANAVTERGGLALFLDHTNHDNKDRAAGSRDKKAAVDMLVMVSTAKNDRFFKGHSGKMTLELTKDRYGLIGTGARMAVRVVANADHTVELVPLGWGRSELSDPDELRKAAGTATDKLSTLQKSVAALKQHGPMTTTDLAEKLGLDESVVRSALNRTVKTQHPKVRRAGDLWKAV